MYTTDPQEIGRQKSPEVEDPYLRQTDQRWFTEVADLYPSDKEVWTGEGYVPPQERVRRRVAARYLADRLARRHVQTDRIASRWLVAREQWLDQVFDGGVPESARFAGKMDFQAVFMMGPPGAGKSFVKARMFLKHTGFRDIDSDEMKKRHPEYDPMRPERVHEWSIKEQVTEFYRVLPTGEPFVYDGTGWDPKPVGDRIQAAKAAGYRTFLVYVYVPVEVSLFRNRNRGRFVPERVIQDKADLVQKSFAVLKTKVDKFKVVPNFTKAQLDEAKTDMALYPPPQAKVPPRPGSPNYGQPV